MHWLWCKRGDGKVFKSDWINKEQKSFATTNYGEGVQKNMKKDKKVLIFYDGYHNRRNVY